MPSRSPVVHRSVLLKELKVEFPELRERLNRCEGLLHFEVSEFRTFTQELIDSQNQREVERCFGLAAKFLTFGNARVRNAIAVSYLEDLNFRDQKVSRAWARELLPSPLDVELRELEAYLSDLFSKS